jgi:hypothetical protein
MEWGDVTLLLRNVSDILGIAPMDTGQYSSCIPHVYKSKEYHGIWPFDDIFRNSSSAPASCIPGASGVVKAGWWPPILGTYKHLDHLLLATIAGSTQANTSDAAITRGCTWLGDTLCGRLADPVHNPDPR